MRSRETKKANELAQLRKQNSELRAINETKDEFIALASHQLRTPATGVKQYLGMLLEDYVGQLSDTQKEFVQKAYDSNERQLSTINDLLQVAQIDADRIILHNEVCDIASLLSTIITECRSVAKNRNQKFVLRGTNNPMHVWADPLRLRMAIDNIIDNASKYSDENTTITVTLKTDGDTACITIADRGVGIAEDDYVKLFQKFSRIDNPRSILVGGNGLGLYLAKRIVHAHSGNIDVESEIGVGTTFLLELPLKNMK